MIGEVMDDRWWRSGVRERCAEAWEGEGDGLCGRNSECVAETVSEREWLVNFEKYPIWNRVSETRFPRFQPEVQVEATSKSSLKYSIFTWRPPGPPATSGLMKTSKPSLKDSIYGFKIEPLRLEMLVSSIVYKLDLLTKWLANYG